MSYKDRWGHERTRQANGSRERERRHVEAVERAEKRASETMQDALRRIRAKYILFGYNTHKDWAAFNKKFGKETTD